MLKVEEVQTVDDLYAHQEEWRKLLSQSEDDHLFQTYEWMITWLESFWNNRPLKFLFVRDDTELVALMPLVLDEKGELWCRGSLVFPANDHTPRSDILYRGDPRPAIEAIADHLARSQPSVKLVLKKIRRSSAFVSMLKSINEKHHFLERHEDSTISPVLYLQGDFDSYLKSKPKHFSRELKRKQRKLERAGKTQVRIITSGSDCESALDEIFEIERHSWKEQAGTAFSETVGESYLYREFARRCARQNWLRLFMLHIDENPVAYIYGVAYKNELYALKTSYNQEYRALAPGIVLFGHAIRDAFTQGFGAFDFLGQPSKWKESFATDVRRHVDICCFSPNLLQCRGCRFFHHRFRPFIHERFPQIRGARQRLTTWWDMHRGHHKP